VHERLDVRHYPGAMTKRLRQEDGIALVMALGITVVLIIFVTAMITFTSSSGRSAQLSGADVAARQFADAGLNSAYSMLEYQLTAASGNPAAANLLGCNGATGPTDTNGPSNCTSPAVKVICITVGAGCSAGAAGSVSVYGYYSGTNAQTYNGISVPASTWLIVATGYARNPNTSGTMAKTEMAQVKINPLDSGAVAAVWNHIFLTAPLVPNQCSASFAGNNMTITDPLYVIGNLCITGQNTTIQETTQPVDLMVGGKLILSGSGTSAGLSTAKLTSGVVQGGCNTTGVANATTACGPTTNYYVKSTDTWVDAKAPVQLASDIASDYSNFDPGPNHPCASGGTLANSVFDNDTTQNNSAATFELVPNSSYTCVSQSGSNVGQLSWNNATKVLTITGSVFIDGSLTISQSGMYTGSGVLEVAGTVTFNGNATKLCAEYPCDTSAGAWQGSSNNKSMLTLVSLSSNNVNAIQFTDNSQTYQGSLWTQPSSGLHFVKNGVTVEGPMSLGSFDASFNNATFIPLPLITNMPVGAPLPPNTGASIGPMTITQ
jgi:Tfp pilus assembly protein PilX